MDQVDIKSVDAKYAHLFSEFIVPALAYNDGYSIDDVIESLQAGRRRLLMVFDRGHPVGGLVVEHIIYPQASVLLVFTVAGDRYCDWIDEAEGALVTYGQQLGVDAVSAYARPGLGRILKGRGWTHCHNVMELKI